MISPPGGINTSMAMDTHLPPREYVEVDKASDSLSSIYAATKILWATLVHCLHARHVLRLISGLE